ncbi:peptidoglycan DD-metalloendopeptidase family protein [Candidatus Syntrophocurvum alkaliphilum]|nr:M23 family metallopeptidase [Candidatus Syntrophocurvum alkaliphilum]
MKRWLTAIIICTFIFSLIVNPAGARLIEGGFTPYSDTKATSTDSGIKMYKVESGDTLWSIASTYNVSLDEIMLINNMDESTVLTIGQRIEIPYSRSRVHVVGKGETMWEIADRYGVRVDKILQANTDKSPTRLRVGDRLIIPDSSYKLASTNNNSVATASTSRGVTTASSGMGWPLVGTITSPYGWRNSGFHHGLDIAGNIGDPIRAATSGTVSFVGYKSLYGNTVIIDHPNGRSTLYAHASTFHVQNGQQVGQGDIIAEVGVTGRTTGPHVHFEVRKNGNTYDPLNYLRY